MTKRVYTSYKARTNRDPVYAGADGAVLIAAGAALWASRGRDTCSKSTPPLNPGRTISDIT